MGQNVVQTAQNTVKINQNGASTGPKYRQSGGLKAPKVLQMGSKSLQMAQNNSKQVEMWPKWCRNRSKEVQMGQSGGNMVKMVQSASNGPKSDQNGDKMVSTWAKTA